MRFDNFKIFWLILGLCLVSACASDPYLGRLAPTSAASDGSKLIDVLVASTRIRGERPYTFTIGRSEEIQYQRVQLSIPPNHKSGAIEFPNQAPGNPASEFTALSNQVLSVKDFQNLASKAAAKGDGEVTVFVHGFNTTYEEAVFRLGQIAVDAEALGAVILFSWPSRGRVLDYLTDRESATFSRDRLETVLRGLASQPGVRHINVLAHSMGAFLTMETLRQAKLRGDGEFGAKLNAVVLAAPDIDIDVFRSQLAVIGRRPRPTIVLISRDDKALAFSRFLSGDVERVGVVEAGSPEAQAEIAKLGLIVIDLTAVNLNNPDSHGKFAAVPGTTRYVGELIGEPDIASRAGLVKLDKQGKAAAAPP